MLPEKREQLISLEILKILDECGNYLLPEHTLFIQLNIDIKPPALMSELSHALKTLEALKLITGRRPDIAGDIKWKITDLGRAQLQEEL